MVFLISIVRVKVCDVSVLNSLWHSIMEVSAVVDHMRKMTSIVRRDPSITVKDLTREMGFAEQKSVYYWLDKHGFRGLREFKRAVLSQRSSFELDKPKQSEQARETSTLRPGHRVISVPVATAVSTDGTPVWSQYAFHMEFPEEMPSSVYAIRARDLFGTGKRNEWLIVDPIGSPKDGSLVVASRQDGSKLVARLISFGSVRRYFSLGGEEVTSDLTINGVLKARIEYLVS